MPAPDWHLKARPLEDGRLAFDLVIGGDRYGAAVDDWSSEVQLEVLAATAAFVERLIAVDPIDPAEVDPDLSPLERIRDALAGGAVSVEEYNRRLTAGRSARG